MTEGHDVTVYQPSNRARWLAAEDVLVSHQLAGWLAADMEALVGLVEVTEPAVFSLAEVQSAASRLLQAISLAVSACTEAVEPHRPA